VCPAPDDVGFCLVRPSRGEHRIIGCELLTVSALEEGQAEHVSYRTLHPRLLLLRELPGRILRTYFTKPCDAAMRRKRT
jgi:hypothetical protein